MKNRIVKLATLRLTSGAFDTRVAQYVCWIFALLMLVITMRKISSLELTEAQLLFGILLAFVCPMLAVILGLLIPLSVQSRRRATTA